MIQSDESLIPVFLDMDSILSVPGHFFCEIGPWSVKQSVYGGKGCRELLSKCGRSVYPEQNGFFVAEILPAVSKGTLEVKTIAHLEAVTFQLVKPDLKMALQHVYELLAVVSALRCASVEVLTQEGRRN